MKKSAISAVMSAIFAVSAIPPVTSSAAEKEAGYVYTIIDNEATITGFEGEPTYIEIPETIEGCRVTEIRDNSFYECGSLKHITLPDTIEKIGHHAFYACYSLESITIPDSVTELGMGCFCGCESLTAVTLSDNLKRLPDSCFRSCTSLTSFEISDNITEIGDFCFSGCTSLTDLELNETVETLGDCSFYMCGLEALYVPSSVEQLGVCSVGYTPTDSGASQVEGFTVLGKKKSAAADYAKENSLTFRNAEDSVHAFAIQRVNGQRVAVPSVFLFGGGFLILAVTLILLRNMKFRKK
ncbi:MAG: leucine-rich repeat domain-containing protein [Ruminococcus sp.]|nr:leucine-rich repeat domain-containing protein [Ruminococcus sp.]